MNISSISSIVQIDMSHLDNILRIIEDRDLVLPALPKSRVVRLRKNKAKLVLHDEKDVGLVPIVNSDDGEFTLPPQAMNGNIGNTNIANGTNYSNEVTMLPLQTKKVEKKMTEKERREFEEMERERRQKEMLEIVEQLTIGSAKSSEIDGETGKLEMQQLSLPTHIVNSKMNKGASSDQNYDISSDRLSEIMQGLSIHPSDQSLLLDLFCLLDKRGFGIIDARDLMISFTVLISPNVKQCIKNALSLFDRTMSTVIDKEDLYRILSIINESCFYFGDRNLSLQAIVDLSDSIFTNAGKIDGLICYDDYIDFIADHPVIEMFIAPQYQGLPQDKLIPEYELPFVDISVRVV